MQTAGLDRSGTAARHPFCQTWVQLRRQRFIEDERRLHGHSAVVVVDVLGHPSSHAALAQLSQAISGAGRGSEA